MTPPREGDARRERPNLLFLMADQQRADTVAAGGPCQTPHLDALAAQGTSFRRCYAPSPICSPTRASLMTGLLPHAHGMVDVTHAVEPQRAELKPDLAFWSRSLQRDGYRTAFFGRWHVERSNRLEGFGFDHYELLGAGAGDEAYLAHRRALGLDDRPVLAERRVLRHAGYRDFLVYGISDEPVEATQEHYLYSRAIAFLRALHEEDADRRPWAVFVSTEGPHDPYVVPRAYFERYDPGELRPPASFDDEMRDRPGIYRRIQGLFRDLDWPEFARASACYYAFCTLIDEQVGRLLATVRELGQERETLTVYTSDHGDYLGAHRMLLKSVAPFEEAYRIPLVLAGPGVPAGRRVDEIVSLLDLPPTLMALTTGSDFPCHGRSLLPLLNGSAADWPNEAFAEMHGQRFFFTQRTLWQGRHKYVFNGFDEDELYDLEEDPHELRNLIGEPSRRPIVEALAARMWAIARQTGDRNLLGAHYGVLRFAPVGPEAAGEVQR